MALSPEVSAKLGLFRQKAVAGTLSIEEMREAIQILREDRMRAASTDSAKRTRARKEVKSAEELLSQLDGL